MMAVSARHDYQPAMDALKRLATAYPSLAFVPDQYDTRSLPDIAAPSTWFVLLTPLRFTSRHKPVM
jgi:hypothetical protein